MKLGCRPNYIPKKFPCLFNVNTVKLLRDHFFRIDGAEMVSSILAKFILSLMSSLLLVFPIDSFPVGEFCSLLLSLKKPSMPSLLELRTKAPVPFSVSIGVRSPAEMPLGCDKLGSSIVFILLALRDGKIKPVTSGIHSCQTLRYLASFGIFKAPSPKKLPLASTSQFCCLAQCFLIWSVTWLESVFDFSGR